MRSIFTMLWFLFINGVALAVSAQNAYFSPTIPVNQVPPKIMTALKEHFAAAHPTTAEVEFKAGSKIYQMTFLDRARLTEASFTADGKMVQVSRATIPTELPVAVLHAVVTKYPAMTIRKSEEIIRGDRHFFKIAIRTANQRKIKVTTDQAGNVVKIQEKTGEGDDDES